MPADDTGYAGAELVRLLSGHPHVDLVMITSRQFAGRRFDRVFPSMAGRVDLVCQELDDDRVCAAPDVIFTALPHKMPMNIAPEILKRGRKVIDLSADFRFKEAGIYESVYQPHTAPDLLKESVYGLSEVYAAEIAAARLVGNPGCYPTSVLLPLIPLMQNGLLETDGIVADAKSGVSGAGRSPSLTVHYCEVNESFKAYKVAAHRHAPEMEAILSRKARTPVQLTFVPHLVPMTRGILTTIYARPCGALTVQKVQDCLAVVERFKGSALRGKEYERLFDYHPVEGRSFYVVEADFVTTEDGSGIVHMAPAYGEDDYHASRQHGIPTIHYVSPSVWAWRRERVKTIARSVTHILALFPFEPKIYEEAGVPVSYVGHPMADVLPLEPARAAMRAQLKLAAEGSIIALLPGSRQSELHYMAELFIRTAQKIASVE